MSYAVKEIYFTWQGEGVHTGRPAVFLRFAGCNLWDGVEGHRANALCWFCDTDFVGTNGPGGGRYAAASELAEKVWEEWTSNTARVGSASAEPFVVCTGGEPLLQLDRDLVDALRKYGFFVAVETNGTLPAPVDVDWLCVSPKGGSQLAVVSGDELKLVYPQSAAHPEAYASLDFDYFSLQPLDGPDRDQNTRMALDYCRSHPRWRLSLQTHKLLGIP